MTLGEIMAEYFPELGKEDLETILWGLTGFPGAWRVPERGATPAECLRQDLEDVRVALAGGKTLDELMEAAWEKPIPETGAEKSGVNGA